MFRIIADKVECTLSNTKNGNLFTDIYKNNVKIIHLYLFKQAISLLNTSILSKTRKISKIIANPN